MAKKSAGHGGTPALVALEAAGVAHTVHPYDHDAGSGVGYGLEAAQVLGIPAGQVYKTLMTTVDGELTVAVVPVSGKLDLKALASAVGGKKAAMAEVAAAERATGYVVGGISPLGQKTAREAGSKAGAGQLLGGIHVSPRRPPWRSRRRRRG